VAVAYNYSSTAVETTLSGSIGSGDTSLSVGATTGFPAPPFKLTLAPDTGSEEIVKVTAVVGLALTVVRGHDGSVPLAHSAGDQVRHQATAEDLRLSRQHEDAAGNVHGIGASANVVGTTTTQTLENKTIDDAANTLIVDQGSVTGLVAALAALTAADAAINTNIDDWDHDTAPTVTNTAAPSTYPSGFSIRRILAGDGWPVDGFVFTYKFADNTRALQFFGEGGTGTGTTSFSRHYNGTAWQTHKELTNPAFGANWLTALAAGLDADAATVLGAMGANWPTPLGLALDSSGMTPTLIDTSDGGFPAAVTDATGAFTSNRITVASAAYPRLLIVTSQTLARYSQGGQIDADLFVNSTQIGQFRIDFSEVEVFESFCPGGQFRLPASTAGVVEVRWTRVSGTGEYDVNATEAYFQVSHQRAV